MQQYWARLMFKKKTHTHTQKKKNNKKTGKSKIVNYLKNQLLVKTRSVFSTQTAPNLIEKKSLLYEKRLFKRFFKWINQVSFTQITLLRT